MGGGWPPSVMEDMPMDEFCDWFEEAIRRIEAKNEANGA
jgi:hypothetical protein